MKLVREYINEKFIEDDSDPIYDMGIGKTAIYKDFEQRFKQAFPGIMLDKWNHIYGSTIASGPFYTDYMILRFIPDIKEVKKFFENEPNFEFVSLKMERSGPYRREPFLNFKFKENQKNEIYMFYVNRIKCIFIYEYIK